MTGLRQKVILQHKIAFRSWKVEWGRDDTLVLRSIFMPQEWTPREELVARCGTSDKLTKGICSASCGKDTPNEYGHCGIWALDSLEASLFPPGMAPLYLSGRVAGEVKIWGNILEGTREGRQGFRAQYAYPRSLMRVVCGVGSCSAICDISKTHLVVRTGNEKLAAQRMGFEETSLNIVCTAHKRVLDGHSSRVVREPGWHEELSELYGLSRAA